MFAFFKHHAQHLIFSLVSLMLIVAFGIRVSNIRAYNTWWADDGGAHLTYIDTIVEKHRLPTMAETYVAWHEPAYYVMLAGWKVVGNFFGIQSINWIEGVQVFFSAVFLAIAGYLAYSYSQRNQWVAAATVFISAFVFVGVKLSAYATNELLAQTLILLSVLLFFHWRLGQRPATYRYIVAWSLLVAVALSVKLTAMILLLAALLLWIIQYGLLRNRAYLRACLVSIAIIGVCSLPWFVYKQYAFGNAFSINAYEEGQKQSLLQTRGWQYFYKINPNVVTDYPYWYAGPHTFWSILLADMFGDYYNLFQSVDTVESLSPDQKIILKTGRATTPGDWQAMLWTNRIGLVITLVWLAGFGGQIYEFIRYRKWSPERLFLYIMVVGGGFALAYNVLRMPYPDRGVIKAQFIYYAIPLLALVSYEWWWRKIPQKWLWGLVVLLPILVYSIVAWPILVV